MLIPQEHFISVGLGQMREFTAIAVVERQLSPREWDPVQFADRKSVQLSLRHLERLPLGTPYPAIGERVREIAQRPSISRACHLIVDGTSSGRPPVDMLRQARLNCRFWPVMIANTRAESRDRDYYLLPKRDLVAGLQVLLQQNELRITEKLPFGPALIKELSDMQVSETVEAREGEHDDLVLAVAAACWCGRKLYPNPLEGYDAWWLPDLPRRLL